MFVATFIGSPAMNLYEASLEIVGDAAELVLGRQRLTLPPAWSSSPAAWHVPRRELIVGIRPENLGLPDLRTGQPRPGASLTADVQLVEVLGSEQLVHFPLDARGSATSRRC